MQPTYRLDHYGVLVVVQQGRERTSVKLSYASLDAAVTTGTLRQAIKAQADWLYGESLRLALDSFLIARDQCIDAGVIN